jgi:hypothetical protein
MDLKALLTSANIDPQHVLVMRHRPQEPGFRKVLPWLAAERPDVFNAYQQTQSEKLERVMLRVKYVASFIGHKPGEALFVGLYSIGKTKRLTYNEYWKMPAHVEMKEFGMRGFTGQTRASLLWFDLVPTDIYASWKGKLVIGWPPPERSWWRRAHRNLFPVRAILEESALDAAMPAWDQINLGWDELRVLPNRCRAALSHWRGIYYIYDQAAGKGYVGSAYGDDNLLGRWVDCYGKSGHGGNVLLRQRDPKNFRFTILQRVSPDMDAADVIRLEGTWKERLHTRSPLGLNDN